MSIPQQRRRLGMQAELLLALAPTPTITLLLLSLLERLGRQRYVPLQPGMS